LVKFGELLPLVYPADLEAPELALTRLIPARTDSPWVVLGYHRRGELSFAPGKPDFAVRRQEALAHLRSRAGRAPWVEQTIAGPKRKAKALLRVGDPTTASDLLDIEFLLEAAAQFESEHVYVAAPTQESMLMTADRGLAAHLSLTRLYDIAHDEFVLGPQIFRCDGGGLSLVGLAGREGAEPVPTGRPGQLTATERAALAFDTESDASDKDAAAEDPELGYMPMGLQVRTADGGFFLLLALSEPSLASAKRKIDILLERRLERYASLPGFNGDLRFQLNPEFVPPTAKHRAEFAAMLREKNRELAERNAKTHDGRPIGVGGSIGQPDEPDATEPGEPEAPEPGGPAEPTPAEVEAKRADEARRAEEQARRAALERTAAPPVESLDPATRRRQERLALAGALLTTLAVCGRFALALEFGGAANAFRMFFGSPALSVLACLALILLELRGNELARAGFLGLSSFSLVASVIRLARAATLELDRLVAANAVCAVVLLAAFACLALGRTRGTESRHTARVRPILLLGFLLGATLPLAGGFASIPHCVAARNADKLAGSCENLAAAACTRVPGCRVITPVCATQCRDTFSGKCIGGCALLAGECKPPCAFEQPFSFRPDLRYCKPDGACVAHGDVCQEACPLFPSAEACNARPFCRFVECAGTPTVQPSSVCAALSLDECVPRLCNDETF
jgi:hypothetical protein